MSDLRCGASVGTWRVGTLRGSLSTVDADIGLLQEVARPKIQVAAQVIPDPSGPWQTQLVGRRPSWRTAIVRLSDRVGLRERPTVTLEDARRTDELVVSRMGSITVADVVIAGQTLPSVDRV